MHGSSREAPRGGQGACTASRYAWSHTARGLDTAARLARDDVNTGCVVVSPAEPILLLLRRAPVHFRRANLYGKHQRNCEPLGERRRMSS
jgi:hypothetical protein